jgi:hypothetical protein
MLALVVAPPASACLNDRDTAAYELSGLPDVARIIVGRFPINPPLYYQMRIARESAEVAQQPDKLDDYDDLAVSNDRLGDDNAAIAWMAKKCAHLPPYDPNNPTLKEAWYRYYANVGTCMMHRWVHNGANRKDIDQVKQARDLIARAIVIKPNAHLGREKYQLMIMDWVIDPSDPGNLGQPRRLASVIMGTLGYDPQSAVRALGGLVVLGGAWRSPDIFQAMNFLLWAGKAHFANFAAFRAQELKADGVQPLVQNDDTDRFRFSQSRDADQIIYGQLRDEAGQWQARRTAYMIVRLRAGLQPDTDPTCWAQWRDNPPPIYHRTFGVLVNHGLVLFFDGGALMLLAMAAFVLVAAFGIVRGTWRLYRRLTGKKVAAR